MSSIRHVGQEFGQIFRTTEAGLLRGQVDWTLNGKLFPWAEAFLGYHLSGFGFSVHLALWMCHVIFELETNFIWKLVHRLITEQEAYGLCAWYIYLLEQLNLANLCPSSAIKDHQSGPHYSKCRPHKSQANVNLLSAILNATTLAI